LLHVYAPPLSEITVPKLGFEITFDHGTGVACPGAIRIMYSRPFFVKPTKTIEEDLILAGRHSCLVVLDTGSLVPAVNYPALKGGAS